MNAGARFRFAAQGFCSGLLHWLRLLAALHTHALHRAWHNLAFASCGNLLMQLLMAPIRGAGRPQQASILCVDAGASFAVQRFKPASGMGCDFYAAAPCCSANACVTPLPSSCTGNPPACHQAVAFRSISVEIFHVVLVPMQPLA